MAVRLEITWRTVVSKLTISLKKWPLGWQLRGLGLWLFARYSPLRHWDTKKLLELTQDQQRRLDACCQLSQHYQLPNQAAMSHELTFKNFSYYVGDLLRVLTPRFLDRRFMKEFGDVTWVPASPAFVKSRPISNGNQNSVLLPLDARRHLIFPSDPYDFNMKLSKIVWRGASTQMHRQRFLSQSHGLACCDVGDPSLPKDHPHHQKRLGIYEQMRFKYLVSIEGNDVATNLKWIMNSNSLCLMPKPRYETWFLESQLQAGVHYVELEDDYGNLQAVFDYYEQHPDKAMQIIHQAQAYTAKFKDATSERLLTQCVAAKYFQWTE